MWIPDKGRNDVSELYQRLNELYDLFIATLNKTKVLADLLERLEAKFGVEIPALVPVGTSSHYLEYVEGGFLITPIEAKVLDDLGLLGKQQYNKVGGFGMTDYYRCFYWCDLDTRALEKQLFGDR